MNLRHLRYFVTVAAERSFTRAAERLRIAQPPLSRQMKELESELRVRLFDRESRPVALTGAGHVLLTEAHRVLGAVAQLEETMERVRSGERRRFTIGFVGSTIYGPVPELIRRFRDAAPELDVDLAEMNTRTQIDALNEGRIDAGLGRLAFEDPAVSRRVLEYERLIAAIPLGHASALATDAVPLADLVSETLILYPNEPRPSYADQVLGIFHDYDLRPRYVREVRELQTALGLVAAAVGVAVVPASVQRLRRDDVIYRPIAETAVSPIFLSWRTSDVSSAIDVLLRIASEMAPVPSAA